jgi:hypothetical protein
MGEEVLFLQHEVILFHRSPSFFQIHSLKLLGAPEREEAIKEKLSFAWTVTFSINACDAAPSQICGACWAQDCTEGTNEFSGIAAI